MIKKTVIRRAYKSWPMTDTRQRIEKAVDLGVEADEIVNPQEEVGEVDQTTEKLSQIRELLKFLDRGEEKFVEFLVRAHRREIKELEDLTEIEMDQAIVLLEQFAETKKKKEESDEVAG